MLEWAEQMSHRPARSRNRGSLYSTKEKSSKQCGKLTAGTSPMRVATAANISVSLGVSEVESALGGMVSVILTVFKSASGQLATHG